MKGFLAVSVVPGTAAPTVPERALAQLSEATVRRTEDGWVAFGRAKQDDRIDPPGSEHGGDNGTSTGFTVRLARAGLSFTCRPWRAATPP
jgi:hypothetical protein